MSDGTLDRDGQRRLAARLLARRLDGVVGHWRAEGAMVIGPGTTGIGVVEHAGTPDGHVDLGFVLDRARPGAPIIWDCAAGAGDDPPARLERAVESWMVGTWPVIHELLSGRGSHATRCDGSHRLGLPGWQVLMGPVMAFGAPAAAEALQDWALANPVLARVAGPLVDAFDRPALNGIKLAFGGADLAEVRVNGRPDAAASAALAGLDWPRSAAAVGPGFGFVRLFALAVSPDRPSGAA